MKAHETILPPSTPLLRKSQTYDPRWFHKMAKYVIPKIMPELRFTEAVDMLERIYLKQDGYCALTKQILQGDVRMNAPKLLHVSRIREDEGWHEDNIQLVAINAPLSSSEITVRFSNHAEMTQFCTEFLIRQGRTVT